MQNAVSQLVEDVEGLQRIAAGVTGPNSKARITCLEVIKLQVHRWFGFYLVLHTWQLLLRLARSPPTRGNTRFEGLPTARIEVLKNYMFKDFLLLFIGWERFARE